MAQWSKSNTRHRYAPLNTSEPTIRLFQVVRDASSECKGHLKHFHVANAPSYRALSYTWGTNHVMKEICVDGMQFRIRSNLYAFLEHYASRHAGRGEWLWIDQICIDQDSTAERNHQVQLMSEIYRGAKEVLIWLHTSEIMNAEDSTIANPLDEWYWLTKSVSTICEGPCRDALHEPIEDMCSWVRGLVLHEYWQRLWIIQEVLLAKCLTVWYGPDILSWPTLRSYVQCTGVTSQIQFLTFASSQIKLAYLSLELAVSYFHDALCEDVRDKVYGLQSLISKDTQVPVDYAKSPEQVWVDTVMVMFFDVSWPFFTPRIDALKGVSNTALALATAMGFDHLDDNVAQTLHSVIEVSHHLGFQQSSAWQRQQLQTLLSALIMENVREYESWRQYFMKRMSKHNETILSEEPTRAEDLLTGADVLHEVKELPPILDNPPSKNQEDSDIDLAFWSSQASSEWDRFFV